MSDSFIFGETPFYFLRHGETLENERGIVQGQTETELTAKGRKTAEQAGARLIDRPLRSIYASPLKRVWRTASIVSALTGVSPIHPVPGLMERNWGIYEGRPKSERPTSSDHPSVETMEAFSARILAAMHSISGPAPLLVVAHSGVFRVLGRHAGLRIDSSTSVGSGHLLLFEPSPDSARTWRISEVSG